MSGVVPAAVALGSIGPFDVHFNAPSCAVLRRPGPQRYSGNNEEIPQFVPVLSQDGMYGFSRRNDHFSFEASTDLLEVPSEFECLQNFVPDRTDRFPFLLECL